MTKSGPSAMKTRPFLDAPDEKEVRHACRPSFIIAGFAACAFATNPIVAWGFVRHRPYFLPPLGAFVVPLLLSGGLVALGMFLGWCIGEIADKRTSSETRRLVCRLTDIGLLLGASAVTLWSLRQFWTAPWPVSGLFLFFSFVFLAFAIDLAFFGGGRKLRRVFVYDQT